MRQRKSIAIALPYNRLPVEELDRLNALRAATFVSSRLKAHDAVLDLLDQCAIQWVNLEVDQLTFAVETYDERALEKLLNVGMNAREEILGSDRLRHIEFEYGQRDLYPRSDVVFLLQVIDAMLAP